MVRSHEAIYQALFVQANPELRNTRRLSASADSVCSTAVEPWRQRIVGRINISERTAEADDRAVPGHGKVTDPGRIRSFRSGHARGAINPVRDVDQIDGKNANHVADRIAEHVAPCRTPDRPLTWDQGANSPTRPLHHRDEDPGLLL